MDSSEDFQSQQKKIQAALLAVNRTVGSITSEDLTFQRTVNPSIATRLDDSAGRLLRLTNALLKSTATATNRKQAPPVLEDAEDVDLEWQGVVDVIDSLLERADTTLDEYTGILKRKDAPTMELGPEYKKPKPTTERLDWSLRHADIPKPQKLFERPPQFDNMNEPWVPQLSKKPHATVPLAKSLNVFLDEYDHKQYVRRKHPATQYKHPYETEITQMKYPDAVYKKRDPISYLPPDSTKATWVDTMEGVEAMLAELRKVDEIAVDLEHHDYRTYGGLLSLMQISTRKQDWIVDTLQPWRHRLEILNEVFADPTKIKVFHGATSDIVWLQRDLGLYIVGLFDTYFACDCLEYPARSLAYLLKRFVDFDADKKYQMADWRIRPIPEEMLYYARSDTHYLLYVYDMVCNELADKSDKTNPDKDLTEYVLQKSKETSLLRFEPPFYDHLTGQGNRGWFNSLMRSYAVLNGDQFAAFKNLFEWRDQTARANDESPGYIMPMKLVLDIARILPPDQKALWSLLRNSCPVTKASAQDILKQIKAAQAPSDAKKPGSSEFVRAISAGASREELESLLHGGATTAELQDEEPEAPSGRDMAGIPDVNELRSDFSQLWGPNSISPKAKGRASSGLEKQKQYTGSYYAPLAPAESSSSPDEVSQVNQFNWWVRYGWDEAHAQTSLPELTSESTPEPVAESAAEAAAEEAADPVQSKPKKDEPFTLTSGRRGGRQDKKRADGGKDTSKKNKKKDKDRKNKKAKRSQEDTPGEADSASGGQEDSSEASQTTDSDGGAPLKMSPEAEEFVPFNYETAKSVLHQKADNKGPAAGGKGGRKAAFNPYAAKTTADGPKAARRMHFEKNGKTGTFK